MRTFAVFVTVVVVGLVVGLVGGCGGTPDASPPPSPSPSASPTASATPTAPVMPDAARENTKAGAVAFVRHYVAVLDHGIETGDVSKLRQLAADSCGSCSKVVNQIERIYRSGGHSSGGTWKIVQARSAKRPRPGSALVYAVIRFAPQRLYPTAGATPTAYPGGQQLFNFELKYSGAWRITDTTTAS